MFKVIAFDLDGTLVDSLEDLADATNTALERLGFPPHPVNDFRYLVGNGVDRLLEEALPEGKRDPQTIASAKAVFQEIYGRSYCEKTLPYDSVPEMLEQLADDYKIAVLSNKPDSFVKVILEALFPDIRFDYIKGADDSVPKKPAPEALLRCLEELHADPEECLYCGDSDVDVLFAHNAGVQVAGAAWGFRGIDELDEADADYVINYPTDLLTILDILN